MLDGCKYKGENVWDEGKRQLWERRLPFYIWGSGKAPEEVVFE